MKNHPVGLLVIGFIAAAVFLQGCSAVLNPYDAEFQCPDTYNGKCVGMQTAYEESVEGVDPRLNDCTNGDCPKTDGDPAEQPDRTVKQIYLDALYNKMRKQIEDPQMPELVAPEPKRVLVVTYPTDDSVLMGWRFLYFVDEKPRWVYQTMP